MPPPHQLLSTEEGKALPPAQDTPPDLHDAPAEPVPRQPLQGRDEAIVLLLALLTVLIFLPALRGEFVNIDDFHIVVSNPHVTHGLTPQGIRWAFTNIDQGAYFPLTWLSFQLDAQLYGMKSWGFHLTNIALHAINVALLFTFLRLATGSSWRSAALAAIWAVHPLRVESVAWVTERKMCFADSSAFSP